MSQIASTTIAQSYREALVSGDISRIEPALEQVEQHIQDMSPVTWVDLLERSVAAGNLSYVQRLYACVPYFVYESWALVLALRCGHEDIARWLIDEAHVDLLGPVTIPRGERVMLPHEGAFTRAGLTRKSITLFLNPMDPTLSTYIFTDFTEREALEGKPYYYPCDLTLTCDIVRRLAAEKYFEPTIFDDLFRAAMVRAWKALRHAESCDRNSAQICLTLALDLMQMHRTQGLGDERMKHLLGCLIVPRVSEDILSFIAQHASYIFMEKLEELVWLQKEPLLIKHVIEYLEPATPQQNELLLTILAAQGYLDEIKQIQSWEQGLTALAYEHAIVAASESSHAEVAAYLLAQKQELFDKPAAATSDVEDDFLGSLLL